MEHELLYWISQYGYFAIFGLLTLGVVGLPVPDETLLTLTGALVARGQLHLPFAFVAALCGSASGITVSYILGRTFGLTLIHRYGKYVRIREDHLEKAHGFFDRAGHWGLTFGYFIPGVRHFTAYAAGMSCLDAKHFALFAYLGAFLWVSTFLSIGYFLGERWQAVEANVHRYLLMATVAAAIALIAWLVWRKRRSQATP